MNESDDPKLIAKRRKEFMKELEANEVDWSVTLGTAEGQRVIRQILELCHIHEPSVTADTVETAIREGQRSIGVQLMDRIIGINPQAMIDIEAAWILERHQHFMEAKPKQRKKQPAEETEDSDDQGGDL